MDPLTDSILWCIVQITLVGLLAWLLCTTVSRWAGPGTAIVPAVALAAVVVLTACVFVPWPNWWRYGPQFPTGPKWQAAATASSVASPTAPTADALPTSREDIWARPPEAVPVPPFDARPGPDVASQASTTDLSQPPRDF